ncbi:MAG: NYN domain-containing protein [Candidatus Doudnabacteria bacterium]
MNDYQSQPNNLAYIDGQNLFMGTTKHEISPWKVDLEKFRVYLANKYKVKTAYYFLGWLNEDYQDLYTDIQEAGFVLVFREHNSAMLGNKKGNVDCDIIFSIMKKMYKKDDFDKVVLVSGDGDYKMLVDFLISENRFLKVLFPNKKYASSLYKKIGAEYFDQLENPSIKSKIMQKEKGSLGN